MRKDYTKYKADELLNDDYFLQSELYPTEKSRMFWHKLQQADNAFAEEFESARLFLRNIKRASHNPTLPVEDEKELWKRIQTVNTLYDKRKKKIHLLKTAVSVAASLLVILTFGWQALYDRKPTIDYEAMLSTVSQTGNPSENVQLILSEEKKYPSKGKTPGWNIQRKGISM